MAIIDSSVPAKLLIFLTGHDCAYPLVNAARAGGGKGGTVTRGFFLPGASAPPGALPENQEMAYIVMMDEADAVRASVRKFVRENPAKKWGYALILKVPELFGRMTEERKAELDKKGYGTPMDSNYKLIITIVNHGYGAEVMKAARAAGARGGTLMKATGTGTDMDVKFFGVPLVPEKEMLLIAAKNEECQTIVEAMRATDILSTPGGGVIFSLLVDEFLALGAVSTPVQ